MQSITSKTDIRQYVEEAISAFNGQNMPILVSCIFQHILQKKVRFPLLEYAAAELYQSIPADKQLVFTDAVIELQTIGSNVIAGIILQKRLNEDFDGSVKKATEYIILGNQWYVCDIIGERVLGHALLITPQNTLPVLQNLSTHSDKWMVRSIGVAAHYAIKKGLNKKYAEEIFKLLLQLSNSVDFHTKKGIGWAAKTTAKFHPDIIAKHKQDIQSDTVKQWFKTKVNIGLGRSSKYAHRYTG